MKLQGSTPITILAFPAFRPNWNALEGARELYAAYRAAGMTPKDFQSRRFTRVKQLRFLLVSGKLDTALRWTASAGGATNNSLGDK